MDFRKFRITKDDEGRRTDRILRRFLPEMPLSAIYKLMRNGLVRIDGKRIKPEMHPVEGSELWIADAVFDSEIEKNEPSETPIRGVSPSDADSSVIMNPGIPPVLYETADLLFVNKPAGVAVHGGDESLEKIVPKSASEHESLSFRTGPLHRLDQNTSGLLAFSRSLAGARWFSEGIRSHSFEKYYLGVAEGILDLETVWTDTDEDDKTMKTIAVPLAKAKPEHAGYTLIRYRIITGRKHQIRIQSSLHAHPLAGDSLYGGRKTRRFGRYFLHAWQMVFPPDRLGNLPEKIVAPLPSDFEALIREFFGEYILARLRQGDLYWDHDEELQ